LFTKLPFVILKFLQILLNSLLKRIQLENGFPNMFSIIEEMLHRDCHKMHKKHINHKILFSASNFSILAKSISNAWFFIKAFRSLNLN